MRMDEARAEVDGPAIVYITGWGRSGSTVLNRLLAENGALGLGEVRRLWRRGVLERQDCGCGHVWDECPVWSRVVTSVVQTGWTSAEACAADLDRAAFTAGKLASTPARLRSSAPAQLYVTALRETYRSAAEATGATVLVDSSKDPTQALLARQTGLRVSVVHLVRDPRAVVWSHRRRKSPPAGVVARTTPRRPAAYVATRWLVRNAFIDARVRPEIRLRYEDLIGEPENAVRRILGSVDHEPGRRGSGSEHAIAGNPNRFERGALQLRADDEWTHAQPWVQRGLSSVIAAPLLGRYGYPLWPRR